MLMNNLDAEVAESPQELVVYGGIGRAARDWRCYDVLVATLKTLGDDETLLVQSGKPVGVFRTHADAPRVLIANSNLVAHWATWDKFHALDRLGLMMYGQMTAGSWIYIGSQGIIQGTYETFVEAGRQHYGGDLRRQVDPDRRARRHGRRAAARRDHGRRLPARGRVPGEPHRAAPREPLSRSHGERPRRGAPPDRGRAASKRRAALGRPARQRRGGLPRAGPPRRAARHRDRPDRGARSPARLPAGRLDAASAGSGRSRTTRQARRAGGQGIDGGPGPRHARLPPPGRADPRLRQQHPPVRQGDRGRGRVRVPGLRAGLHPPAVLPRQGAVPLGGAVRRPGGHRAAPTPRSRS